MSRYRLLPTPAQETVLREHCAHARDVWNLAVAQHPHWRAGPARPPRPGGRIAGALRPRPVRLEPGGPAAHALAAGPDGRARLPGAVPAAHRRAERASVAGGRLPDGAAGAAGLRPGDDRV